MPAFAILAHFSISERMKPVSSCGFMGATSVPSESNRAFTSGLASDFTVTSCSRVTTGAGVLAGATSANQAISS